MNQDGKGFAITVTMRSSTLSSVIDGVYITGGLTAEWLVPRPAVLPLAIALIAVYLVWSLGPHVRLPALASLERIMHEEIDSLRQQLAMNCCARSPL